MTLGNHVAVRVALATFFEFRRSNENTHSEAVAFEPLYHSRRHMPSNDNMHAGHVLAPLTHRRSLRSSSARRGRPKACRVPQSEEPSLIQARPRTHIKQKTRRLCGVCCTEWTDIWCCASAFHIGMLQHGRGISYRYVATWTRHFISVCCTEWTDIWCCASACGNQCIYLNPKP